MSLYNEYEAYMVKYIAEYGKDTIVLYRCGSFYEIYSIDDGLVDIKKLCELLNIQMSKRNKAIPEVSRNNCLMAGFPAYTLQKFVGILVNDNYTVVIVDQVTDPPKPQRAVTAIVSPGTDLSSFSSPDANNLIIMYFEENIDFRTKSKLLSIGMSVIDISTGSCKVLEAISNSNDYSLALDEAYRVINIENPKEIVLFGKRIDNAISILELEGRCVHDMFDKSYEEIHNLSYQTKLLQKIYPKHGLMSVIEYLDLERHPVTLTSFVYMLEFVFKHNEHVLTKIQKPVLMENSQNLILSYNAVRHLNIIGNDNRNNTLLSMLNKCVTSIGKRRFREWFLNPVIDVDIMRHRYDNVDFYKNGKLYEVVRKHLGDIYDIERLQRRVQLKLLQPCEMNQLVMSCCGLLSIYNCTNVFDEQKAQQVIALRSFLEQNINMDIASKYTQDTMDTSFFDEKFPKYSEVTQYQKKFDELKAFFDTLTSSLNLFIGGELFKHEYNQVDGYHLVITVKRYKDVEKKLKSYAFQQDNIQLSLDEAIFKQTSSKTCFKITHPVFARVNQLIDHAKIELVRCIKETYIGFLDQVDAEFASVFQEMIKDIGEIDFYSVCAKTATDYNYVRPVIVSQGCEKSFVQAKDLRHPIIERITSTGYIPNDVNIGKDVKGILLYGTNMVGKSAYMKSIGLSIIMAQCGMFVPATHFEFCPYTKIFTRIPSGDDLFKGQSTFAVEIAELRNILKRADEKSLVIGDELASGTESISAVAIVGSGVCDLYSKGSSFVFATHLHDLTALSSIKTLTHLKVYHMSVHFDDATRKLVYNRKLQEGQGSTLYGLEVCRALDMGTSFLTVANEIRRELLEQHQSIIGTKKSVYNASHFVDVCSVCGNTAKEVHHIKQQAHADTNGFVGHVHKNAIYNLLNVCEECHDKIHADKVHIEGYIQTSDGVEVHVRQGGHDKEDEEIQGEGEAESLVQIVQRMRNEEHLSLQKIKAQLAKDNVMLSIYKIQQLLKAA
jgi:DNA mismatch repair protein MutS